VATVRTKVLEYAASVDRAGRISAEGSAPVQLGEEWTPEHLLLAALGRCSLASLVYHAKRAQLDAVGSASAHAVVTRREEDGRYAVVDVECALEVDVDPEPPGEGLAALVAKAERDCFVSASLVAKVRYRWRVNGRELGT
jgi:organic hydroperoxide reductase OsmC/OhrA